MEDSHSCIDGWLPALLCTHIKVACMVPHRGFMSSRTTLSDITDGSGTHIITQALDVAPLVDRFSPLKWPHQLMVTSKVSAKLVEACHWSHLLIEWKLSLVSSWCMGFDSFNDMAQLLRYSNQTNHHIDSYNISGWPQIHQTWVYFLHEAPL
jgi:hypothetical protein